MHFPPLYVLCDAIVLVTRVYGREGDSVRARRHLCMCTYVRTKALDGRGRGVVVVPFDIETLPCSILSFERVEIFFFFF